MGLDTYIDMDITYVRTSVGENTVTSQGGGKSNSKISPFLLSVALLYAVLMTLY